MTLKKSKLGWICGGLATLGLTAGIALTFNDKKITPVSLPENSQFVISQTEEKMELPYVDTNSAIGIPITNQENKPENSAVASTNSNGHGFIARVFEHDRTTPANLEDVIIESLDEDIAIKPIASDGVIRADSMNSGLYNLYLETEDNNYLSVNFPIFGEDYYNDFFLPEMHIYNGRIVSDTTNMNLNSGEARFISRDDKRFDQIVENRENGFTVMLNPDVTYDIFASAKDYIMTQDRTKPYNGMEFRLSKGCVVECWVVMPGDNAVVPVSNAEVYLMRYDGDVIDGSFQNPVVTGENGHAVFMGVDPKIQGMNMGKWENRKNQTMKIGVIHPVLHQADYNGEEAFTLNKDNLDMPKNLGYVYMTDVMHNLEVLVNGYPREAVAEILVEPFRIDEDNQPRQISFRSPIYKARVIEDKISVPGSLNVALSGGIYGVQIESKGSSLVHKIVKVPGNPLEVNLDNGGWKVSGLVYGPEGTPASNLKVIVSQTINNKWIPRETVTDQNGEFSFGMPDGAYLINAFYGSFRSDKRVEVHGNDIDGLRMEFDNLRSIDGVIRGIDGSRIDNFMIMTRTVAGLRSSLSNDAFQQFSVTNQGIGNIDSTGSFKYVYDKTKNIGQISIAADGYFPFTINDMRDISLIYLTPKK